MEKLKLIRDAVALVAALFLLFGGVLAYCVVLLPSGIEQVETVRRAFMPLGAVCGVVGESKTGAGDSFYFGKACGTRSTQGGDTTLCPPGFDRFYIRGKGDFDFRVTAASGPPLAPVAAISMCVKVQ